MDLIPPEKWNHVNGVDNLADCASRGLFPAMLVNHKMLWYGPGWLKLPPAKWPKRESNNDPTHEDSSEEICHHSTSEMLSPVIPLNRYSDFHNLKRIQHG